MILALDTSTALASVALYDGSVVAECSWWSGRNHSVELMTQVAGLMRLRHVEPQGLKAVAVANGPGSYTGLRVGLATAKGLCLALNLPLVAVCTLDILAEGQKESCLPVRPVLDAGRHRYATALYRREGDSAKRISAIVGHTMLEIISALREPTLLCGDLSEAEVMAQAGGLAPKARLASPASSLRRAGFLGEIGWRRFLRGDVQPAAEVEALYLEREDS